MKKILLFLMIITTIFVTGCEGINLAEVSDKDLERISEKAVVCNEPYIRFGTSCCLDKDSNKICDVDEVEKQDYKEEKVYYDDYKDEPAEEDFVKEEPFPGIPSEPAVVPILDMEDLIDNDAIKGDKDAPITIIEWSDFECPFCERFYSQTLNQIDEQYIETGKVKFIYRDFPLSFHPNAQKAAEAAECAKDQGKFWEMHDKLFESGVEGGVATFKQYANTLGLDTTKFATCLNSGEKASEVKKDMADGTAAGIRGTPGFVINGKIVSGAQPFAVFQQIIDAELSG